MSGFCVFGMTKQLARRLAEQSVDRRPPPSRGGWTPAAYEAAVAERQSEIERDSKARQISPALDAPQFCEDWMDTARSTGQLIAGRIMVRGKKVDKKGGDVINKRTGAPAETWVPYQMTR